MQPPQQRRSPPADSPAASSPASAAVLDALSSDELIDLYFEAQEAGERDVVLAKLCRLRGPQVDTFLLAMLAHEDDIFLRLAAAQELMQRGFGQAREVLLAALHASGDDEVFEEAMNALVAGLGAEIFADLAQIFADKERDASERLAAMRGMERSDPVQAQQHFLAALAQMPHAQPFDPAMLEAMLGCFVREATAEAPDALTALLARLAPGDDEVAADARRSVEAGRALLADQAD